MKSKFTIIKEEYNPETFESIVVINTNLGNFEGRTVADEIDKKYPSVFNGNAIALSKALRKYAKAAIRQLKAELKSIKQIIRFWARNNDYEPTELPFEKDLFMFRKNKADEIKLWETRVSALDKSIQDRIAARDRITKAYQEKDKKN